LAEGIISNEFAVGDKLPTEPELMKIYGVGRSSIREAIKILSIKGVLDTAGSGTLSFPILFMNHWNLRWTRHRLKRYRRYAPYLILKLQPKQHYIAMKNSCKKSNGTLIKEIFSRRKKALECYQADINFHVAIAEACGNSLLREIYKIASSHILRSFEIRHNDTTSFIISQAIHERLYLAIENKNTEEAAIIAQQIVDQVY
jgi:DNA-binding FadR family transcriptional regulator